MDPNEHQRLSGPLEGPRDRCSGHLKNTSEGGAVAPPPEGLHPAGSPMEEKEGRRVEGRGGHE